MNKTHLGIIGKEVFEVSLIFYLLLFTADFIRPGVVSNFLNLNYVLLVVLISTLMFVGFGQQVLKKEIDNLVQYEIKIKNKFKKSKSIDGIK
jgi:hypothetical protein